MWRKILKINAAQVGPVVTTAGPAVTTESFTRTRPPKTNCRQKLREIGTSINTSTSLLIHNIEQTNEASFDTNTTNNFDNVPEDVCCKILKLFSQNFFNGMDWPTTWGEFLANKPWSHHKKLNDEWRVIFKLGNYNPHNLEFKMTIFNIMSEMSPEHPSISTLITFNKIITPWAGLDSKSMSPAEFPSPLEIAMLEHLDMDINSNRIEADLEMVMNEIRNIIDWRKNYVV